MTSTDGNFCQRNKGRTQRDHSKHILRANKILTIARSLIVSYIEYLSKDFFDIKIKTDTFVSGKKKFNPTLRCIMPIITLVIWCRPIFLFFFSFFVCCETSLRHTQIIFCKLPNKSRSN